MKLVRQGKLKRLFFASVLTRYLLQEKVEEEPRDHIVPAIERVADITRVKGLEDEGSLV